MKKIEPSALRLQIQWVMRTNPDAWTFKYKTCKARSHNFHALFPNFFTEPTNHKYDQLNQN